MIAAAFILVGLAVMLGVLGILVCEEAVRGVRKKRRPTVSTVAEAVAQVGNAVWEPVYTAGNDGTRLSGWLFSPAMPNGNAVVLLHGLGRTCERMAEHARFLLRQHYTVLVPDSRAHGGSGGDLVTYGLREVSDVCNWADWLCSARSVKDLYGFGESLGAAVLLQALAASSRFKAVVAECPFSDFHRVAYDWVAAKLNLNPRLARIALWPAIKIGLLYARLLYGLRLADVSPERAVTGARVPVLLIHGIEDRMVPLEHAHRLQSWNPQNIALWEVPGAGHTGALCTNPDEYAYRVLQWFTSNPEPTTTIEVHQCTNDIQVTGALQPIGAGISFS